MNFKQIIAIKEQKKKELLKKYPDLNNNSGIYWFTRSPKPGELNSQGILKEYKEECYIGQAKHLLDRIVSHFMPFSHDHLAISLSKYDNWDIKFNFYPLNRLDIEEKLAINIAWNFGNIKLLNNSSGGQGSKRGKHLEGSDFKQKVEQKRLSVENRAKRKLEKHIEGSLSWKKYFEIQPNTLNFITIKPKDSSYLKGSKGEYGELTKNAQKELIKLRKLLGEKE